MTNAIFVAAGFGSRFKEMTKSQHKALLPVNEIPNMERTIRFLNEAGITDITILTGYLHELFDYLPKKYPGVRLIYNDKYDVYNNLYTFSLGLDHFSDTFVIDGDTVLGRNIFQVPETSTYFITRRKDTTGEWCPEVGADGFVQKMRIPQTNEELYTLSGVTYWTAADAEKIKKYYPQYLNEDQLEDSSLFWDNIPIDHFDQIHVKVEKLPACSAFEMDNQADYAYAQSYLAQCEKNQIKN
ncbi:NTP transferase domain-containing protein [Enterococcus hirae]|jgi:CTP:phosphocholine cytidylyltransferase-like protein|nr:NTP transferase domain-containing protein [Enterococcaceae bacterium]MDM8212841.1 NTP transferase domain-containing protein [Enterococcus hirae]